MIVTPERHNELLKDNDFVNGYWPWLTAEGPIGSYRGEPVYLQVETAA